MSDNCHRGQCEDQICNLSNVSTVFTLKEELWLVVYQRNNQGNSKRMQAKCPHLSLTQDFCRSIFFNSSPSINNCLKQTLFTNDRSARGAIWATNGKLPLVPKNINAPHLNWNNSFSYSKYMGFFYLFFNMTTIYAPNFFVSYFLIVLICNLRGKLSNSARAHIAFSTECYMRVNLSLSLQHRIVLVLYRVYKPLLVDLTDLYFISVDYRVELRIMHYILIGHKVRAQDPACLLSLQRPFIYRVSKKGAILKAYTCLKTQPKLSFKSVSESLTVAFWPTSHTWKCFSASWLRSKFKLFDLWSWVRSRVFSYLPRVVPSVHCCWETSFPIWGTLTCDVITADGVTGASKITQLKIIKRQNNQKQRKVKIVELDVTVGCRVSVVSLAADHLSLVSDCVIRSSSAVSLECWLWQASTNDIVYKVEVTTDICIYIFLNSALNSKVNELNIREISFRYEIKDETPRLFHL
uniref:Ig-like domain-containing protein n=1 Tax=Heterorhabditis bacteriophora TaxID=37862 RepID=A0A1I7WDT4_HETBA